jgi:hypothetical protein
MKDTANLFVTWMYTESFFSTPLYILSDNTDKREGSAVMRKAIWGGIGIVIGAIIQSLVDRLIDWSVSILPKGIPFGLTFSDILLIIGIILGASLVIWGIWSSKLNLKRIDRVEAFIFFPKATAEESKTLDYHKRNYHKKIIRP